MSEYSEKLSQFINRTETIRAKLNMAVKSEVVYEDISNLVADMMQSVENCTDDMFYPAVYNAVATIRSAPEKCPVSQLCEALSDATEEMKMMAEYVGK